MILISEWTTLRRIAPILMAWMALLLTVLPLEGVMAEDAAAFRTATPESPQAIKIFLENALKSETANLADIDQSLQRWQALVTKVSDEINTYRIQNTTHGNMLLISQTRVEELEAALNSNRLAVKSVSERIAEFEKIGTTATDRMAQVAERLAIAERQKRYLNQEKLSQTDTADLQERLDRLIDVLEKKKRRGEAFLETYNTLFGELKSLQTEMNEMRRQLEARLAQQIQSDLFERTLRPFARIGGQSLKAELVTLQRRLAALFTPAFWRQEWGNVQRSGGVTQSVLLLLFAAAVVLRRRIRHFLHEAEQHLAASHRQGQRLSLTLLRRTFLLICAALLLWFYDLLKLPHVNISLGRFLNHALFALLFTRWGAVFVNYRFNDHSRGTETVAQTAAYTFLHRRLRRFFRLLPVLVLIHLAMAWILGNGSIFVWCLQLALELVLLVWVMGFWRSLRNLLNDAPPNGHRPASLKGMHGRLFAVQGWSVLVALGAVLMEVSGYGALAGYWLVSWAETLMIALWALILWWAIDEWRGQQHGTVESGEEAPTPRVAAPVGWFMIQMTRLIWLVALISATLLAWSSAGYMTAALKQVFNFSFSIGSLSFSVKGLLMAVVIVCATHMATRIGRRILREKVLSAKDLERGLKDSIIAITSYVVWGAGLLLALGFLGVSTTSLAVVFGALSIGIGFGLQNIFNNFVSGLILLFERPIQVGDYVDIDGLWAEVKQINVRSTIVQTFDNATVIIPNSDFISQRVTNWSFKDPRMRRHVDVGVAYGSDIELVRATLLEIAAKTKNVLKYPSPDVLFMDHADSALAFRLRYWTHVDNYYSTSTEVRFELDRRFRELGIEIAFPQRDVHIRSADPALFSKGLGEGSS
jgi:potassium-dependent mechanosensitive channel